MSSPDIRINYSGALSVSSAGSKITAPSLPSNIDLDPIEVSPMDLAQLRSLGNKMLNDYLDVLTDVTCFEANLSRLPESCPPGIRRGISRRMKRHLGSLEGWGIVAREQRPRTITNYFTVEKKNGLGRLVVDGRKVNRLMRFTPRMELPSIVDVAHYLMRNKYYATVDGKAFFYQFPLGDEVGRYFCANLADTKGDFVTVRLRRMPMGWSWAPAIAQHTANTLLDEPEGPLGIAWVDNFVFAGETQEEVRRKFERFLTKARKVGLTLDTEDPPILSHGEVLGLEVDLANARYRMPPEWAERKASAELARWMTPRQTFQVIGPGIWSTYARQLPLCRWEGAIGIVVRIAGLVARGCAWDTPLKMEPDELTELARWQDMIAENAWAQPKAKLSSVLDVWSDASQDMWAYLAENGTGRTCWDQGSYPDMKWHIFLKEAWAAHQAVQATRNIPRTLMIDNAALVFAIRKRFSSVQVVNRFFRTWDWDLIDVRWVPTDMQKADRYTRGEIFGENG